MELAAKDFVLKSVQLVMFTNKPGELVTRRILGTILGAFQDRYDGEPQAIPIPAGAPAELPRVLLASNDGQYRLDAAVSRVNSYWNRIDSDFSLKEATNLAIEPLAVLCREMKLSIGRCSLVAHRLAMRDDAAQYLAEKFCNETTRAGPISRSDSFEIHNHKKFTIELKSGSSLELNSWFRCRALQTLPEGKKVVLIQQDLNSLDEELMSRKFEEDELKDFFESASKESEEIMSLYFPNETQC